MTNARPGVDSILMAEVGEEANYVRHNRHKIALIFSAMRHCRDELRTRGFNVIYYRYEDGKASLLQAVEAALAVCNVGALRCCEPGEFRLLAEMRQWSLQVPLQIIPDD